MKKILFALIFLLVPTSTYAATFTITPTSVTSQYDPVIDIAAIPDWTDFSVQMFLPNGTSFFGSGGISGADVSNNTLDLLNGSDFVPAPFGTYHLVGVVTSLDTSECLLAESTYDGCIAGASYTGQNIPFYFIAPATPLGSFISMPSATSSLSSIGSWSSGIFFAFGDGGIVEMVAGLLIGGMVVVFVISTLIGSTKKSLWTGYEKTIHNSNGRPMGYRFSRTKRRGYTSGHSSL